MKNLIVLFILTTVMVACSSENEATKKNDTEVKEKKDLVQTSEASNVETQPIDSDEALIATALQAAPKESREGCKVIGYNMEGEFVTLKEGNNEFICLADNPNKERFSAACYHKSLEPFMARGRALKAEGKSKEEIFKIREQEVASGKLTMGDPGATLHIYYASNEEYDPNTGEVPEANYRYVVYMPYATSESTGLPEKANASNHPWIMNPGTHKAHIMISPLAR